MQKRSWRSLASSLGGWLVVLAIPPAALATLVPGAWRAVSRATPHIAQHAAAPASSQPDVEDDPLVLHDWVATNVALDPESSAFLAQHIATEQASLARHIMLERRQLLRASTLAKRSAARAMRHATAARKHKISVALARFNKREALLVTRHIALERKQLAAHINAESDIVDPVAATLAPGPVMSFLRLPTFKPK